MSEHEKEKQRLIAATNKILEATDNLWILGVILSFAEGMTKEGGE